MVDGESFLMVTTSLIWLISVYLDFHFSSVLTCTSGLLVFVCYIYLLTFTCCCITVTWWGEPGEIDSYLDD